MSEHTTGSAALQTLYPEITEDDLMWLRQCYEDHPDSIVFISICKGTTDKLRVNVIPEDEVEALDEGSVECFRQVLDYLAQEMFGNGDIYKLFSKDHMKETLGLAQQINLWSALHPEDYETPPDEEDFIANYQFLASRAVAVARQINPEFVHCQLHIYSNCRETGRIMHQEVEIMPHQTVTYGKVIH